MVSNSVDDRFISMSIALTCFEPPGLVATGVASDYYQDLVRIVGHDLVAELLTTSNQIIEHPKKQNATLQPGQSAF